MLPHVQTKTSMIMIYIEREFYSQNVISVMFLILKIRSSI
jgi:hypothetical protein